MFVAYDKVFAPRSAATAPSRARSTEYPRGERHHRHPVAARPQHPFRDRTHQHESRRRPASSRSAGADEPKTHPAFPVPVPTPRTAPSMARRHIGHGPVRGRLERGPRTTPADPGAVPTSHARPSRTSSVSNTPSPRTTPRSSTCRSGASSVAHLPSSVTSTAISHAFHLASRRDQQFPVSRGTVAHRS